MLRNRTWSVLICSSLLLVACGDDELPGHPAGDQGAQQEQSAATGEAGAGGCTPAQRTLLDAIAAGVDKGVEVARGSVVRSSEQERVYYVAAELEGPGLNGDVGVWATSSLAGDGVIHAVDGVAQEFSDWADGDETDAQLSATDTAAERAAQCAGG